MVEVAEEKANPALKMLKKGISKNDAGIIKQAITDGADPNTIILYSSGPIDELNWAITAGKFKAAKALAENGADVNAEVYGTSTPLMALVQNERIRGVKDDDRVELARVLLENGADPNLTPSNAISAGIKTPLIEALRGEKLELASLFVEHSSEESLKRSPGVLAQALDKGYPDITGQLLEKGARVDMSDKRGLTKLLFYTIEVGDTKKFEETLERGAGVNDKRKTETPLEAAIRNNRLDMAEALLERGAQIDGGGYRDMPPMRAAVWEGNKGAVSLLLKHGADVNEMDASGNTPLTMATSRGDLEMMEFLIKECGADPSIKDDFGLAPLAHAAGNQWEDKRLPMVTLLLENGATVAPEYSDQDIMEVEDAIEDRRDELGMLKRIDGRESSMDDDKVEREYHKKVREVAAADPTGGALQEAVKAQDIEVVKLLLSHDASPAIWNKEGEAAMHLALEVNAEDIAQLLLDRLFLDKNPDVAKSDNTIVIERETGIIHTPSQPQQAQDLRGEQGRPGGLADRDTLEVARQNMRTPENER